MRNEISERLVTLSVAAFGLVAALAWNDAIKALFNEVFGTYQGIVAMFGYAIVVTVVAVMVTIYISKLKPKEEK